MSTNKIDEAIIIDKTIRKKSNVLADILGNDIAWDLFIEHYLTGKLYCRMLKITVDPLIIKVVEANPNEFIMDGWLPDKFATIWIIISSIVEFAL